MGPRHTTSPEEMSSSQQLRPSIDNQKLPVIYKLFLLEKARSAAEQDLRNFTKEAYEKAQSFLNSSLTCSASADITKSLNVKCHVIQSISALLKGLIAEPQGGFQTTVQNEVKTNQVQPFRVEGMPTTDAIRFGPILKNSLIVRSIDKVVQVLGDTVSLQQLKPSLPSQPATIQQDDMMSNISSNFNSTILTTRSPYSLKTEEQQVVFDENSQPDPEIVPSVITQSHKISSERPQLLPPIQSIVPEISNSKPMSITPLISWGDVQVQHQKQKSSQLYLFFRDTARTRDTLEVTVTKWIKTTYALDLPQSTSSTIKSQSYQFSHVVTDDLVGAPAAKTLHVNMENQAPVFRVKSVKSGGPLIYSWVITTETELWDIGDILTGTVHGESEPSFQGTGDNQEVIAQVDSPCVNVSGKAQSLQCTEADNISAEARISTINSVNIPQFQIRKFEETEVFVSHIVNPGNFYIQHVDSLEKLQPLITDSWKAGSSYAEQNCIPDLGTLVMGWFPKQEQWCRAQVMKICGVSKDKNAMDGVRSETSITVEVKRLDHGDTACLSLWNINELTPEVAALPLQAVQVALANVTPVNGSHWSEESVGWFKTMVHNKTLYARLYPQGPKVTAELFLEKGKLGAMRRGASLSLRLAQNGHATHNKLKNTGVMKRRADWVKAKKQDSDWEKYLISYYTQSRK